MTTTSNFRTSTRSTMTLLIVAGVVVLVGLALSALTGAGGDTTDVVVDDGTTDPWPAPASQTYNGDWKDLLPQRAEPPETSYNGDWKDLLTR